MGGAAKGHDAAPSKSREEKSPFSHQPLKLISPDVKTSQSGIKRGKIKKPNLVAAPAWKLLKWRDIKILRLAAVLLMEDLKK